MKKILIVMLIFLCSFIIAVFLGSLHKAKAAYLFDSHIIAGGMSGTDGIPIKVDSDGKIYLH